MHRKTYTADTKMAAISARKAPWEGNKHSQQSFPLDIIALY